MIKEATEQDDLVEGHDAGWWRSQSKRYKEETAKLQRKHDEMEVKNASLLENQQFLLNAKETAHQEQLKKVVESHAAEIDRLNKAAKATADKHKADMEGAKKTAEQVAERHKAEIAKALAINPAEVALLKQHQEEAAALIKKQNEEK